ncbi:MAG: hypothetical protein O3A51_14635, partial [Verrucomicrobia bacterium]|nr:hypothetical protein [Verrucomicrobiota bacterium]
MNDSQPSKSSPWRVLFVERRLPWKVKAALWWLKKKRLTVMLNLRYRRPLASLASLTSLHRMLNPARLPAGAIPVIINNFNRLETLQALIDWIQTLTDDTAIIVLDNASTYPPLAGYYQSLTAANIQIVRLGYNSGLEGIEDIVKELKGYPYYVVTDPDMIPYPDTPTDILSKMRAVLERQQDYSHVGASIEIDDIPEHYPLRDSVRAWESRYWPPEAKAVEPGVYEAWVDTTFGMYRRTSDVTRIDPALRLGRPYRLKHADWYMNPAAMTDEQKFYQQVCTPVASWTVKLRDGDNW